MVAHDENYDDDDLPELTEEELNDDLLDDDAYNAIRVEHICPVCGQYDFEDFDTYDACPVCGWQDDSLQEDEPDYAGGANKLS